MLGQTSNSFGWGRFGNWPTSRENNMENSRILRFRDFSPHNVAGNLNPPAVWIKPQSMVEQCDILRESPGNRERFYSAQEELDCSLDTDQNNNNSNSFPNSFKPKLTLRLRPVVEVTDGTNAKRQNYIEIPIIRIKSKDNLPTKGKSPSPISDTDSLSDYDNLDDEDSLTCTSNRLQSVKIQSSPYKTVIRSPPRSVKHETRRKPLNSVPTSRKSTAIPIIGQGLPVRQSSSDFFSDSALPPKFNRATRQPGISSFSTKRYSDVNDDNDVVLVEVDKQTSEPCFNNVNNDKWIEEGDFVMLDDDETRIKPARDHSKYDLNRAVHHIDLIKEQTAMIPPQKVSGMSSPVMIEEIEKELSLINSEENSVIDLEASDKNLVEEPSKQDDSDVALVSVTKGTEVLRHKLRYFQQIEEDILSSEMLSDEAINLGQNLLHQQFPEMGGLEDTSLGAVYNFSRCEKEAFIQILHDMSCHWVCVTNIGCKPGEVKLYDTLYYGIIKPAILRQITCIMKPAEKYLKVNVQPIQRQQNSTDCGVFALAFATSLLVGQDPTKVVYDISQIRLHLMSCLEKGKMMPFPTLCEEGNPALLDLVERISPSSVKVALVCSCRAPFDAKDKSDDLVVCKSCGEFYHTQCEDIPLEVLELEIEWRCASCRQAW